ncbi:MAG: hypothetical protein CME19_24425 [Gemmatimonadetes bacterium]|nr:hypothetical protein [Gemmatimonadota bacterium]
MQDHRTHSTTDDSVKRHFTPAICLLFLSCVTAPTPSSDRGQAIAHYDKAVGFYAQEQYQDAVEEYQLAVQDWPNYTEAHFGLGASFIKTGFYRGAVIALRRAIDLKPECPEAYANLGLAEAAVGRPADAAASLRQAVDQDPDLWSAWISLGRVYCTLGQIEDSLDAYREAVTGMPYHAHIALASHYKSTGDLERLISHLRAAAAADSTRPEPWSDLGNAYQSRGDFLDSREAYLIAIDRSVGASPQVVRKLADVYAASGEFSEAARLYGEVLAEAPDDAALHYNLAVAYDSLGRHDEAIASYRRAIELDVGFVDGYLYLATALIGNRRLSEALDAYDAYLLCAEEGDRRYQVEVLAQKLRAALGR